jgi:dihydrofolate reductase
MDIAIIVAIAENRVIGKSGSIPWHYPEDLAHFKKTTTGHPVIMGRRTFEGIFRRLDQPLPNRVNIVLSESRKEFPDGVLHATTIDEALNIAERYTEEEARVFVIGGQSVYDQFMPLADQMIISRIPEEYDGDTHFPAWDGEMWKKTNEKELDTLTVDIFERVSIL